MDCPCTVHIRPDLRYTLNSNAASARGTESDACVVEAGVEAFIVGE